LGLARVGRRVLYVSYDGVLEPLGESQVVAYLERLVERADITLLSFEKPADLGDERRVTAMRSRLDRAGITWISRSYTKRPPVLSTAFDVLRGCLVARRWAKQSPVAGRQSPVVPPAPGTPHPAPALVHARGYVPALIALFAKRACGARFVFDMRGFWVDEKVEAGHWAAGGTLYRVGKWCERKFFAEADAIVSLTEAGVREFPRLGRVRDGVPVVVIPTCADLDRFRPSLPAERDEDGRRRRALGVEGALVVGCVGTLSNWYLREETLSYLAWLSRRFERMKALIVTREDHGRLRADAVRAGLPGDRLVLTQAPFEEMPALMRLMDVGVCFIRVCFSKRASAATKLAEFLACGVPLVINDGIGDSGEIVRSSGAGLVLPDASPSAFDLTESALRALLAEEETASRCRATAVREFNLTEGAVRYAQLYDTLLAGT
jgi:glycosyltransferase involved in cell wall biosynthesis